MFDEATRAVGKFNENALGYSISEKDMNREAIKEFYNENSHRLVQYGCTSWGMRGHYLYRRDDDKCFNISKRNDDIQSCKEISWEDVKEMYKPLFEDDEESVVEIVASPFESVLSLRLGAPHPSTGSGAILGDITMDI
jgi:hypothetical protein